MIETVDPAALGLRDRAAALHRAGKLAEARAAYAACLALTPRDASTWSNYGALLRSEGRHDLAMRAQERAFALDPGSRAVRNNLANILSDLGQYDHALSLRRSILAEDPGDAAQKAMIGKALRAMGRHAEGIGHLERAVAEHPDDHELRIQLALTQLADGRYSDGFRNYDARWLTGEMKPRQISRPRWRGEDLAGKTILVLPEQGLGDSIAFARFLPVLRQFSPRQVLMVGEKPLLRLFDGIDGVDWVGPSLGPETPFDVWTNLMDLPPVHFDQTSVIPPPTRLNLPADSTARARAIVAPHRTMFKVGVVWCGSVTYRGNAFRSFSHTALHSLLDLPGIQLFSLYKGPELAAYHADGTAGFIIDAASTDRDLADCAATMREMDLIVTSDTATAHLAGSLGLPVWTLLHWDAFWLWQRERERTPWYPSMRLIRQETPRDWTTVMRRVRDDLAAFREAR